VVVRKRQNGFKLFLRLGVCVAVVMYRCVRRRSEILHTYYSIDVSNLTSRGDYKHITERERERDGIESVVYLDSER